MYFAIAIWWVFAAIGILSLWLFFGLAIKLFDGKWIESTLGYPNYFIVLAAYALLAVPIAATLDNGFEHDFIFLLGVLSLGVWALIHRLEVQYKRQLIRQREALAAVATTITPPPLPSSASQPMPAYTAAPASPAGDFDVPPQGRMP
ncbi:hypothetical protein [Aureimonas psammosilenae]|uniref:hypothetical protein n=1 Tax=Aureimonas psammosilenae TaxID=2495496 RepID=UPI00186A647F|nr:hypothetical protein [Aureimonas psammosilenae]